jgi:hypothetical protein
MMGPPEGQAASTDSPNANAGNRPQAISGPGFILAISIHLRDFCQVGCATALRQATRPVTLDHQDELVDESR